MAGRNLVDSKLVFQLALFLFAAIPLCIYLTGLEAHRTVYLNTLTSASVLCGITILCFCFALYRGWKLRDTMGNLQAKFSMRTMGDFPFPDLPGFSFDDSAGDGLIEAFFILLWKIILYLLLATLLWLIGGMIWAVCLLLLALLYAAMYRACRQVLKNASQCKGNFFRSLTIAGIYSGAYFSWLFIAVILLHRFHFLL